MQIPNVAITELFLYLTILTTVEKDKGINELSSYEFLKSFVRTISVSLIDVEILCRELIGQVSQKKAQVK